MNSLPEVIGLPDVAVVIPLHNGAPWIAETLAAVRAQRHRPHEVIVVDDGSRDGSPEIVAAEPGVRLVQNPRRGANAARRHGQGLTTAPLLAFLDQDDLWHPDHLGLLATALARDPTAPAAVCATRNFAHGTPPPFDPPALDVVAVDPWLDYPSCFTPTPSGAVIRRDALEATGGWTDAYVGVADFYTWLRLSERRPLLLNRCTSTARRLHAASHSMELRANRARAYARNKVEAAVAATRFREEARPEDAEALARMRDLVRAVEALVCGVLDGDRGAVATAALAAEKATSGLSDERVRPALGNALFYLGGALTQDEAATWGLLIEGWPNRAPRTGRLVREHALRGLRLPGRLVARRPTSVTRWRLLATAVAERARRRMVG